MTPPPFAERVKGNFIPRVALFTWSALIIVLSIIPVPLALPQPFKLFSADTLAHAAFYLPLGALLVWAYPTSGKLQTWLQAAGGAFFFGFLIELIQAVLPWRYFEWVDSIANLIGGSAGAAVALFSFSSWNAKRNEG